MSRKLHGIRHDQWEICQRCGQIYYLHEMAIQKGLRLCLKNCWDNLDVERRPNQIARILSSNSGSHGELVDHRALQFAFYIPDRWEQA